MDLGIAGRRALVTAASRGLGRACAESLAAEGARVFVSSRDEAALARTAREIGAAGHLAADLSDPAAPATLVAAAAASLGGLDILVCNAGGPPPGTFESTDLESWDLGYQLTLMSAVRLVKAALPHLKASDQGRIVNITSISVRQPLAEIVLSNSFRAAVTGMAKTLALEVAPHGITVNNIAPDAILTDRLRQLHTTRGEGSGGSPERQLEDHARSLPMRRLGDPRELGALCAFLCSSSAGYLTGQTIGIDGGALRGVH